MLPKLKISINSYCFFRLGTHLFVKVPRPGNSEVTFSVFESSCQVEAIPLNALPKDTISELSGLSPH